MPPNKPLQPTAFGGGCAAGVRRRRVRRVLVPVFLAIGAAANVIVAWCFVAWGSGSTSPPSYPDGDPLAWPAVVPDTWPPHPEFVDSDDSPGVTIVMASTGN